MLPELQLAFTADHETGTRNLIKQPAHKAAQATLCSTLKAMLVLLLQHRTRQLDAR
jgi:hypothetical protein